jgi:hypothetical protein
MIEDPDPEQDPDPDPYLRLMDPDPDSGGPKTRGSGTLAISKMPIHVELLFSRSSCFGSSLLGQPGACYSERR